MSSIEQQIRRAARRHGVDPNAAVAVAMTEGGLRPGAVGDQGTSFGPFQLHRGGAMPRGRSAAWASSPAGIDYALARMAASGAQGLTGRAAVSAIVRGFERPANPGAEVSKALGYYGGASRVSAPFAGGLDTGTGAAAPGQAGGPNLSTLQALLSHDPTRIVTALHQARPSAPAGPQNPSLPPAGAQGPTPSGGLKELFYDPLGGIKNGRQVGAIGGHGDHVHLAAGSPQEMLLAINTAKRLGLHVGENPYVGRVAPVHVTDSYHYRDYPGRYHGRKLGEAIDVSGDPRRMAAFYKWAARNL